MINEQDINTINSAHALLNALTLHTLAADEKNLINDVQILIKNTDTPEHSASITYDLMYDDKHVSLYVIKFYKSSNTSLQMVSRGANVWELIGRISGHTATQEEPVKKINYRLSYQLNNIIGKESKTVFNGVQILRVAGGYRLTNSEHKFDVLYRQVRQPYSRNFEWEFDGSLVTEKLIRKALGIKKTDFCDVK